MRPLILNENESMLIRYVLDERFDVANYIISLAFDDISIISCIIFARGMGEMEMKMKKFMSRGGIDYV